MRLWTDTEFNGYQGDLISIALVDENGREFYESLGCADPEPWVAQHVMPIIGRPSVPRAHLQHALYLWLSSYGSIHVIADWPDDIAHFCQLLITGPGERLATPPLTLEVRRDIDGVSACPHNALADALAIRAAHLALEGKGLKRGECCGRTSDCRDTACPYAVRDPQPPAQAESVEDAAIVLWHRFSPDHHLEWEDEPHKAEYRAAAADVLKSAQAEASMGPVDLGPGLERMAATRNAYEGGKLLASMDAAAPARAGAAEAKVSDELAWELTGLRPEQMNEREAAIIRDRAQKRWNELLACAHTHAQQAALPELESLETGEGDAR